MKKVESVIIETPIAEGIGIGEAGEKVKDDLAFLDKLVIPKDSQWKALFDFLMMLAAI